MAAPPTRFRLDALEARLAALDELPRTLWLPAIVHNEGSPIERIGRVERARARLLDGGSPFGSDALTDLDEVAAAFAPVIERLALPSLSRGQPAVADEVLRSLLWHVDQIARASDRVPRGVAATQLADAFEAEWVGRGEALHQVMRLIESLDGLVEAARWSELLGLLETDAWQAILEARTRIETMPGLAALIRTLGRTRPTDDDCVEPAEDARDTGPPTWVRETREATVPGVPVEVDGVYRSALLSAVMPTEFAWRTPGLSPVRARALRRLFAARLAEQALMSWQHRERWLETAWVRRNGPTLSPQPRQRPRAQAGPIVVCVDTSASMAGGPERVAKAIVVEALRTAVRERRRCHLVAFSGVGQVSECELTGNLDGLCALARFVAGSFHGGTDLMEPIDRAIERVRDEHWREADLLIASDGEFGPTAATLTAVERARRELGLRVHGVLIGDRETRGMRSIVDATFWVRDWRRYGDRHGQIESPVHDRNLTTLYFPNMAAPPGTGTPLPGMGSAAR